jgi:hypothetical protein
MPAGVRLRAKSRDAPHRVRGVAASGQPLYLIEKGSTRAAVVKRDSG